MADDPGNEEERSVQAVTVLAVAVAGSRFALALDDVVEVLRSVAIASVPAWPEWMLGVIDRRGELTPVCDLGLLLEVGPVSPGTDAILVVVQSRGAVVALLVDSGDGLVNGSLQRLDGAKSRAPLVSGMLKCKAELLAVLDASRIVARVGGISTSGLSQ